MFRLDPRRTNRSPFVAPKSPRVVWTVDLGGPIAVQPVVAKDVIVAATLSGKIVGVSLDGEVRFTLDAKERIYGSPVVLTDGRVLVGRDKGELWEIDPARGKVVGKATWKDGDCDTSPLPLPSGGHAFVVGRRGILRSKTGTLRAPIELDRKAFASPTLSDEGIVVAAQDDHVHLFDLAGKERWSVAVDKDADATPVVDDEGTIWAATDGGEVVGIAPGGKVRLRVSVGGPVRGALSVARDGTVLVGVSGERAGVVGLDPRTGEQRFRIAVLQGRGREIGVVGAPLEDREGLLVFGAEDDSVRAARSSGEVVWSIPLGGDVDHAVVLVGDGALVVGAFDGKLSRVGDTEAR